MRKISERNIEERNSSIEAYFSLYERERYVGS